MHPSGGALPHAGMHLVVLGLATWKFVGDNDAAILCGHHHCRRSARVYRGQRSHAEHWCAIHAVATLQGVPVVRRNLSGKRGGESQGCRRKASRSHAALTMWRARRFQSSRRRARWGADPNPLCGRGGARCTITANHCPVTCIRPFEPATTEGNAHGTRRPRGRTRPTGRPERPHSEARRTARVCGCIDSVARGPLRPAEETIASRRALWSSGSMCPQPEATIP